MITALLRTANDAGANSKMTTRLLPALFSVLAGCSFVVDAEKTQCTQDSDCTGLFGEGAEWSCQESVCVSDSTMMSTPTGEPPEWLCLDEPPPLPPEPGPFSIKFLIRDMALSTLVIPGATVKLCTSLDTSCSRPVDTKMSDDAGFVTFQVAKAFNGFISVTKKDYLESLYSLPAAVHKDEDYGAVQMAAPGIVADLTKRVQAPYIENRGVVLASMFNCANLGASGVRFVSADADAQTTTFYAVKDRPSSTATETEATGFGGFINAPDALMTIEARRVSDDRLLSRATVVSKPNTLTIIKLLPMKL